MTPRLRTFFLWLVALSLLISLAGCSTCGSSGDDDGTNPTTKELPPLELRDDTSDLLLTWIDEKGDHHVVQKPADVPEEARETVRVVVARADFTGDGDLFYVADLRKKRVDGTYPVSEMTRSAWELVAEKRRTKTMAAVAPPASPPATSGGSAPPTTPPSTGLTAIVYGATWCKACRGAARHLRRRGVNVVEKNIEADAGAKREMSKKLARAGLKDRGSIPVIDIRGQMLMGYNEREIDRAIKSATKGTEL